MKNYTQYVKGMLLSGCFLVASIQLSSAKNNETLLTNTAHNIACNELPFLRNVTSEISVGISKPKNNLNKTRIRSKRGGIFNFRNSTRYHKRWFRRANTRQRTRSPKGDRTFFTTNRLRN